MGVEILVARARLFVCWQENERAGGNIIKMEQLPGLVIAGRREE